ncbi:defective in cullin neddylation protein AAR3-like [Bidens hawaiensis]|uniref:defective in cullin neddylation protein AAR3-like n=1 Tax=Bidens hawaiensis TaxID=980011 RepID=UPI00404B75E6
MDSPSLSNQLDIFQIYRRYCEIALDVYASEGDGYRHANESMKTKLAREGLSRLLELVESRVYKRMSIFEELSVLMSRLNLMVDSHEFSRFYNFVFFICRENGQRSITVSRAIMAWKLVLSGRFRLLNQWCSFIEDNQRHNISEDTWRQVLAFSRCVHENLEGYDPEGAWPVLIDEFVEHMYRVSGSEDTHKLGCTCGDLEDQPIHETLPGLKVYPGAKRKLEGQELESMDGIIISKRRHTVDHVKHNSPCAVEGGLSKGFAKLFSNHSCLKFDHENRVSFT